MATQLDDVVIDETDLELTDEEQDTGEDTVGGDDDVEAGDEEEAQGEDGGEEVDVVTFGGKPVDDGEPESEGLKNLREAYRRERDARKAAEAKLAPQQDQVGERPRLEDYDYDEDQHADAVAGWLERKRVADEESKRREAAKQRQDERWQAQRRDLDEGYAVLTASGKEAARATVEDAFGVEPFAYLVKAAGKKAAPFIFALGNAPDKRAELKALADNGDWAEFIAAAAVMAQGVNVERRKPTTAPEQRRTGTPGGGGARKDAKLERLEKAARESGDLTELIRYKRELARK